MFIKQGLKRKHLPQFQLQYSYHIAVSTVFCMFFIHLLLPATLTFQLNIFSLCLKIIPKEKGKVIQLLPQYQ